MALRLQQCGERECAEARAALIEEVLAVVNEMKNEHLRHYVKQWHMFYKLKDAYYEECVNELISRIAALSPTPPEKTP